MFLLARERARIAIRQMVIEDLPEVWHIGEKVFIPSTSPYTYRTWNVNELVSYFYGDPELCLVAEDSTTQKIVGFALGMILKRPYSPWTYGYFVWCGVRKTHQKRGVGYRLYRELEKRFKEKGARIAMADVEGTNEAAIKFVKKLGFKEAQTYVWLSKNLEQEQI
ncbi:MAG: putative acetyltransferase [Candidatus Bathyarchaeota archaeon BA1]|nr:MAG: putative acetyltransferase [Candidatus Bathyarchaeota archaeon BA1]